MNLTSIDKTDVLLENLASTAKQYPHLSEQRQLALTKLVHTNPSCGLLNTNLLFNAIAHHKVVFALRANTTLTNLRK